jgi:hypothetical protein
LTLTSPVIAVLSYAARVIGLFRKRSSSNGWAFYFGDFPEPIETSPWTNVCANCGAGHLEASLAGNNNVRRLFMAVKSYNCPFCGAWNPFKKY